ncbi:glycosyltransferase family 2 protein [Myroides odoratimimus]|uniref:glycosyltransferase family 2 protein n=1 Tax=Myroides odoratimimus TaxID=76832 RepID=UPI00103DB825|nr:glycosyltransferase family 2 protein [Myroides odoratimimus]QBK77615.1 glycosyltransferase family 2 protein [Myroides odoratimimus]WHT73062.1 glycosyltransferase family 2 protein [Myroides odoratimimus]WHU37645.1 glycosyltransferase family 2 protein [Myroides odoratimimus]
MVKNRISVCLATYNGERYIKQQVESILSQLRECDEIIISDDYSKDKTLEIINEFQDSRIKVYFNTLGKGVVKNFENAIRNSTGEIIFFCDQDDVWRSDKVITILKVFDNEPSITCVFSNAVIIDDVGYECGDTFFKKKPLLNVVSIFVKNRFLGCTMAFRKNVKFNILPFSNNLPMHDWYVGLKHLLKGKVFFVDECLIYYRRHSNNVTSGKRSSLKQIIKWRKDLFFALIK